MDITAIVISAGIPSAIVGLCMWAIQRNIAKNEAKREEKEKKQESLQLIMLDSINGTMNLAEATARAVQRIPDAKCNGDMHAALNSVSAVRERQRQLITQEGIHNIIH